MPDSAPVRDADIISLTTALCAIDSTTGREGAVGEHLAHVLEGLGYTVERQRVTDGRHNLYAWRDEPVVVLSTHMDCVPPFIPPTEDAEWLHGRGTCDAKGLIAAMVGAGEQLARAGERRVGLLFVVGEERGSDGAKLAATLAPRGRYLINGEPTEGKLCIGQKGTLRVDVSATGRAAHSGYPHEGRSAVDALLATLARMQALPLPADPLLGASTLNIGVLAGGVAPNVIPAEARAEIAIRTVTDSGALREALVACAGPDVTVRFPLEIPVVRCGAPPGWETTVVAYSSDLPLLASWGTPFQLGPGTILVAHTDGERIRKAELVEGAHQYARLARQLLAEAA
ncbi:MAG: M20/M25/M40 family metallo-hydrolase [Gemmatimonadales bacterium]|nr:M20/M25/M40 family metallo-hydrolase [Gemmatimonadales bacterium]